MQDHPASNPATPQDTNTEFRADITILILVPWLVLWRIQLFVSGSEIWLSGWPVLGIIIAPILGYVLGKTQRHPKPLLPYVGRWATISGSVVLLMWNLVSVFQVPRAKSSQAVDSSQAAQAREYAPLQPKALQHQIADIRAQIPATLPPPGTAHPALGSFQPTPQAVEALLREHGDELAGGRVPPELRETLASAGITGDEALDNAIVGLAAYALASYFGVPFVVVLPILQALLGSGEIDVATIVQAATGLGEIAVANGIVTADQFQAVMAGLHNGAMLAHELVAVADQLGYGAEIPEPVREGVEALAGGLAADSVGKCSEQAMEDLRNRPESERLAYSERHRCGW